MQIAVSLPEFMTVIYTWEIFLKPTFKADRGQINEKDY